jgi:hypothetical protein
MANIGITQEYINECRSQPENLMLNDMKQKHQRGEPLNYRYPNDGATYVSLNFVGSKISVSGPLFPI